MYIFHIAVQTSNTTTANVTVTTSSSTGPSRGKRSVSELDLEGFRGKVQSMTCGDLADGSGRRVCTFTLVYTDSAGSGAAVNYIMEFTRTIRQKHKDATIDVSTILPVCPSGNVPGNAGGTCGKYLKVALCSVVSVCICTEVVLHKTVHNNSM